MLPPSDQEEHAALIERIIQFKAFVASPEQCKLLRFLYKKRSVRLQAKEIEEQHYKYPPNHPKHDQGHSRERIADLKARLCEYVEQAQGDIWRCNLPDAKRREGYQLEFKPVERTASQLFWKAHAEMPKDVIVVCASHLFFFDSASTAVLRYYDFNVDKSRTEMLEALRASHPEVDAMHLEPRHNPYLSTGEVHAYESLLAWFHGQSGVLIPRLSSRDVSDKQIHRSSPILLGRPQTNKFIGRIMDSPQAAHLRYRRQLKGSVRISEIEDSEKLALSRFPVTADGIVGPVPNFGTAFVIVSRLHNPSGYGFVTIIAGDHNAMVIARIAETMTNDKLAQQLLDQMKWPVNVELPESFEMLFSVTLSPGNLEGEGFPKLLCWRSYPQH
jgi:hypothetical protein